MPTSARDLSIDAFTYDLPEERIARYPLADRSAAKQLIYREGAISEEPFATLADRLPPDTLLVGNRTRVIHARLHFSPGPEKRPIEIFCLDPVAPVDYAQNLGTTTPTTDSPDTTAAHDSARAPIESGLGKAFARVQWKVLIGGNRRWKSGDLQQTLTVNEQPVTLTVSRGERQDNTFIVTFSWTTTGSAPVSFGEVLAAAGTIPLPPYLNRAAEAADHDRYQTVFAKTEGSVAAPTAGLHFTPAVLEDLARRNVRWREVTLHVGAGTFKPVSSPTLGGHVMHREFFTVTREFVRDIAGALNDGHPVVSVGTTSLRCLESLYYLGAALAQGDEADPAAPVEIGQWVATNPALTAVSPTAALSALLDWTDRHNLTEFSGYTQLLLTPAARVHLADGLITNFHQPRSTLLLLVGALVGDDWRRIYDYALTNDFRFLSYGDSSLLWRRSDGKAG